MSPLQEVLFLCRVVCSVATQGRAFPPTFLHHTPRARIAASFLLRLWPMLVRMDLPAAPRMDTSSSPLLDGLLACAYGRARPEAPNQQNRVANGK